MNELVILGIGIFTGILIGSLITIILVNYNQERRG